MSRCLRYKNAVICEHLARQYVVGVMTPRVRKRVETLRLSNPELDQAIISWSESFSAIHEVLPEQQPQFKTWGEIENKLFKQIETNNVKTSLWQNLRFWQFTGVGASLASIVFAIMLFVLPSQPVTNNALVSTTPSYTAVMSPVANKNDIRFVVNAYQKTEAAPSRLYIQWSQRQPRTLNTHMHLWAKDKETEQLTYIGVEPSGDSTWDLKKPAWLAVANSSELIFTATKTTPTVQNTLFHGPCIQLSSWKHNLI